MVSRAVGPLMSDTHDLGSASGRENELATPWGTVILERYPFDAREKLRAWDAADEYLLNTLIEHLPQWIPDNARILVFNDQFGALGISLRKFLPVAMNAWQGEIVSVSDSWIANAGSIENQKRNGLDAETSCSPLELPEGPFDLLLYKLPKNLAYFEDMLQRFRVLLKPGAMVIGAAMVKYLPASVQPMLTAKIGSTSASLAWKKARVLVSQCDTQQPGHSGPAIASYSLPEYELVLRSFSNVFSRQQLDIGTRLFLPVIPQLQHSALSGEPPVIVDLACGNGVVGLVAARRNPTARLILTDESAMANASAKENFMAYFPEREVSFMQTDALRGVEKASADWVLCNPPFHEQNAVGDHIATRMFRQAKDVLKPGGRFLIVGNRHLGYHLKLKRLFGNVHVEASNQKFVVLCSVKH